MACVKQCSGCGAANKFLDGEDVTSCSYCGGFIEIDFRSSDLRMPLSEQTKRKEMYNTILNDPLVRSAFMPKKSPMYIQLPISLYKTIGLKGIATIAFGLLILIHLL